VGRRAARELCGARRRARERRHEHCGPDGLAFAMRPWLVGSGQAGSRRPARPQGAALGAAARARRTVLGGGLRGILSLAPIEDACLGLDPDWITSWCATSALSDQTAR